MISVLRSFVLVFGVLLFAGCDGDDPIGFQTVVYDSRTVMIYDGSNEVFEGILTERVVRRNGDRIETTTSLVLVNRSGFEIDCDVRLSGPGWSERVIATRLFPNESIDLGIISFSESSFDGPISADWLVLRYYSGGLIIII